MADEYRLRPPRAAAWLAAPPALAVLILVALVALVAAAWMGGRARGERLQIRLEGSCAEAARELVRGRVDEIGLGDPQLSIEGEALVIVATMPGLPDERTAMPALLSAPGRLTVSRGQELLLSPEEVEGAFLAIDSSNLPYTEVEVGDEARDRLVAAKGNTLTAALDGETIELPPGPQFGEGRVPLPTITGDTATRMRLAADRAIVLKHGPLPCELKVAAVEAAGE